MGGPLPLYPVTLEGGVLLVNAALDATDHSGELELEPAIEHSGFNLEHSTTEVAQGLCPCYFIQS